MNTFESNLNEFLLRLNSLKKTFPIVPIMINHIIIDSQKEVDKIIEEHGQNLEIIEKDGVINKQFGLDNKWANIFQKEFDKLNGLKLSQEIIPQGMIITIVSQFDGFIGDLMKIVITDKEEIISALKRELSFIEISKFESIDSLKIYLIEKEIESTLRENHSKQIKWFENKLNIKLNVDLDVWPDFIELTERRNLFTHTKGIVSDQYLKNCNENNVLLKAGLCRGVQLKADSDYFYNSIDILTEISVKLTLVLWNKLHPEENDSINNLLMDIVVNTINEKRYLLSERLNNFAIKYLTKQGKESYIIHNLNLAQTFLWQEKNDKCLEILNSFSWGMYDLRYRFINEILRRNFDTAIDMMDDINRSDAITPKSYKEWPIFKELIKENKFLEKYKLIYNDDFNENIINTNN